jgi:hypothetical protein
MFASVLWPPWESRPQSLVPVIQHSGAVDFCCDERRCGQIFSPDAIQEVHIVGIEKIIIGSN